MASDKVPADVRPRHYNAYLIIDMSGEHECEEGANVRCQIERLGRCGRLYRRNAQENDQRNYQKSAGPGSKEAVVDTDRRADENSGKNSVIPAEAGI